MPGITSICVFCGSADGEGPDYLDSAAEMGRAIAARGLTLVYGGGNIGTMGALARAAMEAGGRVVGVIPRMLHEAVDPLDTSELVVVRDMHERKAEMQRRADAFVAMPGGIGTFEEFFEIWTWRYLGYHAKPVGILNAHGFYDELIAFLAAVRDRGFIRPAIFDDLVVAGRPEEMLDLLATRRDAPVLKSFERISR